MVDQPVAEFARDFSLQLLDFIRRKFDNLAVAQINQMIVVTVAHCLIARAAFAKIVPLDDAGILK